VKGLELSSRPNTASNNESLLCCRTTTAPSQVIDGQTELAILAGATYSRESSGERTEAKPTTVPNLNSMEKSDSHPLSILEQKNRKPLKNNRRCFVQRGF
jgi:hypothetical protein